MKKEIKILIALLALHLFLLFNLQFTAWPEMFSFPYLWENGFSLYKDFILPYPPLLILALRLVFGIFGYKVIVLKVFTWLLVIVADVLVYLVLKKLIKNSLAPYFFLIIYILFQAFLDGNMLWFDNALVVPLLGSIYFAVNWVRSKSSKDLFYVGLFLTIASFIKQTAPIYLVAFLIFYFVVNKKFELDKIRKFFTPLLFLGTAFLIFLAITSSFQEFWNWNVFHPLAYWIDFEPYVDYELVPGVTRRLIVLSALLIPGILVFKELFKNKSFIILSLFFAASILATYPRFSFFHLQPTIAFLVLLYALIHQRIKKKYSLSYAALILFSSLFVIRPYYISGWGSEDRFVGKEDLETAQLIKSNTSKGGGVFLLGLHSGNYVFAERIPPKPWVDNFGWYFSAPEVERWLIAGLEEEKPEKIFIRKPVEGNPLDLGVYLPAKVIDFVNNNYNLESETTQLEI